MTEPRISRRCRCVSGVHSGRRRGLTDLRVMFPGDVSRRCAVSCRDRVLLLIQFHPADQSASCHCNIQNCAPGSRSLTVCSMSYGSRYLAVDNDQERRHDGVEARVDDVVLIFFYHDNSCTLLLFYRFVPVCSNISVSYISFVRPY